MTFNLVEAEWIPVLYADGRFKRVGIRRALTEAGSIRQIAASNPMDRVAVVRFLLAILYWCKGNPPTRAEKTQVVQAGQIPEEWFARLDQRRERFELLSGGKRFFQDSSARRRRATTDLIQEIPTGNNFWHFRHSTDEQDGLCAACCALGLIRLPLFSVSGLPDLKAGINGTPPIYVVPIGKSLLETLFLNWRDCASLGTPAWEQPDIRPQGGQPVPILTGLTLLSRRVWLHDPEPRHGACIACGQEDAGLVRTCEYQTAGNQKNEDWEDPHVFYLVGKSRTSLRASDISAARSFKMDRPWVALVAELASSTKYRGDPPARKFLVVGFATDKAKNIDVWERTCSIPFDKLHGDDAALREHLEAWDNECYRLHPRLKIERGRRYVELGVALASVRPHIEARVSGNISDLLGNPEAAILPPALISLSIY